MKKITVIGLGTLLNISTLFGANYKVDETHSAIEFKVRHMMVSYTKGNFDKFNGTFEYNPKTKSLSKVNGNVFTNSINTKDAKRDEHLLAMDFLDSKKYPKMHIELIEQNGDKAMFNLTIKNITKKVEFNLNELSQEIKDPWGTRRRGFTLSATINRKDFGLTFNKVLDTGGLAVADEVKINLEIEGIAI